MARKETENEIKLRVDGPEPARQALARLGAELVRARHLEDNVLFDDAAGSLRRRGNVLRVRRTAEGGVLTFKGPGEASRGVKSRREIETGVVDPEATQAVLEGLGFRPTFRYQKYRETYRWNDQEVVIDETPIGTFLEIEGDVEGIHAAAKALGFDRSRYITDSYVRLFFASGGKGDMVFPE